MYVYGEGEPRERKRDGFTYARERVCVKIDYAAGENVINSQGARANKGLTARLSLSLSRSSRSAR